MRVGHEAGFDSARWDHWLLLICFGAIAIWGLWLSRQWHKENRERQAKTRMARRLMRELHQVSSEDYVLEDRILKNYIPTSGPSTNQDNCSE